MNALTTLLSPPRVRGAYQNRRGIGIHLVCREPSTSYEDHYLLVERFSQFQGNLNVTAPPQYVWILTAESGNTISIYTRRDPISIYDRHQGEPWHAGQDSTLWHMKIISWNCNGALRKKLSAVIPHDADVCVIQECENPVHCKDTEYQSWARNHLWIGTNKSSGLGIFAKEEIALREVAFVPNDLQLFLPCIVAERIPLLAVWTKQANSPTFGYIGQLWKYLQIHRNFLCQHESICIGDFNSNVRWDVWDRWWNHSDVVRELQELGLDSLYHATSSECQGKERTPTFFQHRRLEKPYHIDYAFLSQALLTDAMIDIGRPEDWLQYSDHMPLIIKIKKS